MAGSDGTAVAPPGTIAGVLSGTVWAPGKMLRDAAGGPVPEARDTKGQAAWLAEKLDGCVIRAEWLS